MKTTARFAVNVRGEIMGWSTDAEMETARTEMMFAGIARAEILMPGLEPNTWEPMGAFLLERKVPARGV